MRPDDERFNQFTKHFIALDPQLSAFATAAGVTLEKNAFHEPCRYLRRSGNPSWLIVVLLDREWRTAALDVDMEHSVMAISYYIPPENQGVVWRRDQVITESVPFSEVKVRIEDILNDARQTLEGWGPEAIMRLGTPQENARIKYKDYGLGGGADS